MISRQENKVTDAAPFNYRDGDSDCHGFIYRRSWRAMCNFLEESL